MRSPLFFCPCPTNNALSGILTFVPVLTSERGRRMQVRSRKTSLHKVGGGFLVATLLIISGCDPGQPTKTAKNPKVVVTSPITDTVMDYQDFTGRLEAVKTVDVRSRVTGQITGVPFKE